MYSDNGGAVSIVKVAVGGWNSPMAYNAYLLTSNVQLLVTQWMQCSADGTDSQSDSSSDWQ